MWYMTNVYETPTPLLGPILLFSSLESPSIFPRSYVLPVGVHAIHEVDTLLVHGEDNAAAQY